MKTGLCGLRLTEYLVHQDCETCQGKFKNDNILCPDCGSLKSCSKSMIFCDNCFGWDTASIDRIPSERDNWYCHDCQFLRFPEDFPEHEEEKPCSLFNEELLFHDWYWRCEQCERFNILEQLEKERENENE